VRWTILAILVVLVFSTLTAGGVSGTHTLLRTLSAARPGALSVFLGWQDDFNDTSKVSDSSGIDFVGGAAALRSPSLMRQGAVLSWGPAGSFDSGELGGPAVLLDAGIYKMWYFGGSGGAAQIGYATSSDGRNWVKQGPVLSPTLPPEAGIIAYPEVVKLAAQYRMWYSGGGPGSYRIFGATSNDGVTWTKEGIVLGVGTAGSADDQQVWDPSVVVLGGTFHMWYSGSSYSDPLRYQIFSATSSDGVTWTRRGLVVSPGGSGSLDSDQVLNAAVRVVGSSYEMIYAGGFAGAQKLFYAGSQDGLIWQKRGMALDFLAPDESTFLVQPAILFEPNGYQLVYYAARGSALQIYLATAPFQVFHGRVTSVVIGIPAGLSWGSFTQTFQLPAGTSLNLTVRDEATGRPITGLENRTAGPVNLALLSPLTYPAIQVEASLTGEGLVSPTLEAWQVSWLIPAPYEVAGTFPILPWLVAAGAAVIAGLTSIYAIMTAQRSKGRYPERPMGPNPPK